MFAQSHQSGIQWFHLIPNQSMIYQFEGALDKAIMITKFLSTTYTASKLYHINLIWKLNLWDSSSNLFSKNTN